MFGCHLKHAVPNASLMNGDKKCADSSEDHAVKCIEM